MSLEITEAKLRKGVTEVLTDFVRWLWDEKYVIVSADMIRGRVGTVIGEEKLIDKYVEEQFK